MVGGVGLEEELRRHLELHRAQLAEYEAIERRDFPPAPDRPREDRLRHIVLRAGIELETFWTTWLTDALDELAGAPEEAGTAP